MGCQPSVVLGNNLTFSICTHDADTGALTDTSDPPAYLVYEDETALAILSGTMAKLDDANTTGFYTKLIACTAIAGFEVGKSYTIYIEATVDGITGGISYAFTVEAPIADLLDEQIGDSTITLRQALKVMVAALGGKLSGNGTGTVTIRNINDDTDVIVATIDAAHNRTAIVVTV